MAREIIIEMAPNARINYSKLICTYTLSCREEFNCLDTAQRVRYYKTPVRNDPKKTRTTTHTLTPKVSRSRKRKRTITTIQCDHWIGKEAFCRFCDNKFDLSNLKGRSHLLYECNAIKGMGPLKNCPKPPEKKRMRRLAEIGVAPDPGGHD